MSTESINRQINTAVEAVRQRSLAWYRAASAEGGDL